MGTSRRAAPDAKDPPIGSQGKQPKRKVNRPVAGFERIQVASQSPSIRIRQQRSSPKGYCRPELHQQRRIAQSRSSATRLAPCEADFFLFACRSDRTRAAPPTRTDRHGLLLHLPPQGFCQGISHRLRGSARKGPRWVAAQQPWQARGSLANKRGDRGRVVCPYLKNPHWRQLIGRADSRCPIDIWCCCRDSNTGPTDYESVALPTELQQHGQRIIWSAAATPTRRVRERARRDGPLARATPPAPWLTAANCRAPLPGS